MGKDYKKLETKEVKIVPYPDEICLFCGKQKHYQTDFFDGYDGYLQQFMACDCEDFKKEFELVMQIKELEKQRPQPKYKIVQKNILFPIEEQTDDWPF